MDAHYCCNTFLHLLTDAPRTGTVKTDASCTPGERTRTRKYPTTSARTAPAIVAAGSTATKIPNARGLRMIGTGPAMAIVNIIVAAAPAIAPRRRWVRRHPYAAPAPIANATAAAT